MSYGDVLLTFDSLIAVVPTSGINTNGSVDYAGMGTIMYQGGEATDIFWLYNVAGGSVGVVLDAQGSAMAGMLGLRRLQS